MRPSRDSVTSPGGFNMKACEVGEVYVPLSQCASRRIANKKSFMEEFTIMGCFIASFY